MDTIIFCAKLTECGKFTASFPLGYRRATLQTRCTNTECRRRAACDPSALDATEPASRSPAPTAFVSARRMMEAMCSEKSESFQKKLKTERVFFRSGKFARERDVRLREGRIHRRGRAGEFGCAAGGTPFLDEIGEMALIHATQAA